MDGITARPVVGAVFVFAGQMEGGAVIPPADDGLAGLVCLNLIGGSGLIDLRKGKAVALLNVEDGVIAEPRKGCVPSFRSLPLGFPFGFVAACRKRSEYPFRLCARNLSVPDACLNVSQKGDE